MPPRQPAVARYRDATHTPGSTHFPKSSNAKNTPAQPATASFPRPAIAGRNANQTECCRQIRPPTTTTSMRKATASLRPRPAAKMFQDCSSAPNSPNPAREQPGPAPVSARLQTLPPLSGDLLIWSAAAPMVFIRDALRLEKPIDFTQ